MSYKRSEEAIGRLTPEQHRVTQNDGTERPFTGKYMLIGSREFTWTWSLASRFSPPRILKSGSAGKKLYFNYRRGGAESWDVRLMQSRWSYVPIFPPADEDGFLTVPIGDA